MKNAEYQGNLSCPQRDGAEHEGYAGVQSVGGQDVKEQDGADLLDWNTVVKIRENALMIYTLLLGGCNLPASKTDGLKIPDHDWFDALCIKIQNNRRATLDYVFEYSDGRKVCAVFDFRNNTKEYTDAGMEHYESLRFYCVPDFSLESYEKLDDGAFDSTIITLTREATPRKIFSVNRNKQTTLLYETAN